MCLLLDKVLNLVCVIVVSAMEFATTTPTISVLIDDESEEPVGVSVPFKPNESLPFAGTTALVVNM